MAHSARRLMWIVLMMGMQVRNAAGQTTQPAAAAPSPSTESHYSRTPEQEINFQQALLHYSRGQLPQAESEFGEVIKADPGDAEAFYYLGLSQLDQNKAQSAVANFDRSLQLDPTAAEVRAARATANIRLQKYDAADADLNVLAPDPTWQGLVHYLRGQIAYAKGNLKNASQEFATAKQIGGTESMPASFYEGLTYIRMRDLVQARSAFRESAIGADRDPTVASASQQLDAVLASQQRRNKPWEVQITLAYEYDSNVVEIGAGIPNPAGISHKSDFAWLVQPRGSYSLIRTPTIDAGIEGSGYFTWENDLDNFDVDSYQIGPFLNYHVSKNLYASIRYGFNYINLGYSPFLTRNLVTPQLTYIEPKFGYTSAYYQFQTRNFNDKFPTPHTRFRLDRDSHNNAIGVVQGINLPELFADTSPANLEVSYRFENQQASGSDYDGNFHTVGATLYTPLPFWKLRADLGTAVTFEDYTHGNSLDAGHDKRSDTEYDLTVGLNRELVSGLVLRVDYSYTDRLSNVEKAGQRPFQYDRNQVGVRLIYSY
jgi:tetratricopeptide (TPR) repeat protein